MQQAVAVRRDTGRVIPPGQEIHRIRYRGQIIEKKVPSRSAEKAYATYITDTFAKFAETQIPDALVIELLDAGTPMLLAEHMDWGNGLVRPLERGVADNVEAQFASRGEAVLQGLNSSIPFNIMNPRSLAFLERYGYGLITNIVAEQKELIRQTMVTAYRQGFGGYKAARQMRGQIGLAKQQVRAVQHYRERLMEQGMSPRARLPKLTAKQIESRVARYEKWQHKYRADRIARTELNRAANSGEIEGWRQAADHELIDRQKTMKHWLSYLDNRTSDYCESHDGDSVPLDEEFDEGFDAPPAHPHCRSSIWVEYVLTSAGQQLQEGMA